MIGSKDGDPDKKTQVSPSSLSKHLGRSSSVPTERPLLTIASAATQASPDIHKLSSSTSSLHSSPVHLVKSASTSTLTPPATSPSKSSAKRQTLQAKSDSTIDSVKDDANKQGEYSNAVFTRLVNLFWILFQWLLYSLVNNILSGSFFLVCVCITFSAASFPH
ncbi:hypothetical protein E2C01_089564 [Portunus trituberculatus]|uniref:Uncharacterized protein n=1 Tax=Portunus trituberculatus TaxID=210409 RepID=A0A5B7JJC7_PORTR|nr:hypothetical protein [Portunus trituberculatus]